MQITRTTTKPSLQLSDHERHSHLIFTLNHEFYTNGNSRPREVPQK